MKRPKIINARLSFQNIFGPLGPEHFVTIHHTAGPKDKSDSHALQLYRQYHAEHKAKGWGGIGYHYGITRRGTIVLLRPVVLKGAHVGGHNSNNVGVVFHGTTGDHPTLEQVKAFRYLLTRSHTRIFPRAYRTDRKLNKPYAERLGHNDWSGHRSNACPATHRPILKFRTR